MYLYASERKQFTLTCKDCGSTDIELHLDSEETGYCPSCISSEELLELVCLKCKHKETVR